MPLYEYKCQKCGELVEAIQKLNDPPYSICPHCGGDLKKLISAPAIQFKGSGFYLTDYGRSGSDSAKKTATEGSSAKESSSKESSSRESSSKESSSKEGSSKDSAPATEKASKPKPPSD